MADQERQTVEQILSRIGEGDQHLLAELYEEYRPRLRNLVRLRLDRRLQGRVDPSDVLQEAFLDISERAAQRAANPEMSFFLWLRLMTGQKLLEIHRRHLGTEKRDVGREVSLYAGALPQASSVSLAAQLLGHLTSASETAIKAELRVRLQDVLNAMDELDREVLALRHFEELTNGEVAELLQISKSAASNRYVRALKRLKEELAGIPGFFD